MPYWRARRIGEGLVRTRHSAPPDAGEIERAVTKEQRAYYFAVIIPAVESFGYTPAQAHSAMKAAYFNMHPSDPKLPSLGKMSVEDAGKFMDFAIQSLAEMGKIVPEPRL